MIRLPPRQERHPEPILILRPAKALRVSKPGNRITCGRRHEQNRFAAFGLLRLRVTRRQLPQSRITPGGPEDNAIGIRHPRLRLVVNTTLIDRRAPPRDELLQQLWDWRVRDEEGLHTRSSYHGHSRPPLRPHGRIAHMSTTARVAVLLEEGFDDDELEQIVNRLRSAGLEAVMVAPVANRRYTGRQQRTSFTSEIAAGTLAPDQLAAVIVPGGYAPDRLRMRHAVLDLVRQSVAAGIPVGAIGHGAQVLISAGTIAGRTVTCWP